MTIRSRHIHTIRIDVPQQLSRSFLYVCAEDTHWDPWWQTLYQYLLKWAPSVQEWRQDEDTFYGRPVLTDEERLDVFRFLRSAPAEVIASHNTLRHAVALTAELVKRTELLYVSAMVSPTAN
ncbi:hypothetical protein [Chondromyces crocatus]|uniref:Uncharacterized protein n=1 Tax=Chondromyces crocatus TaxID=52 RepID=A0A0K1ECX3_CHOCO|nr:hypothetical protein [Chondromyces crocatus]AKT38721.1 uncharacterized protein CMC5_028650 [Chondromyces crocatus]